MKKVTYLSIIFCLIILVLTGLMFSIKTAQAVSPDDLIVVFNPNPLFGAVNFAPGQSASGLVEVKNNSGAAKTIITEAINVNDPQKFGDALDFEIKENDTTVYGSGKTLTDFFNAGEVNLSSLSNDVTTTYEYIVTFQPAASDDYQGKKLDNFDILIGFKGEEGGAIVISGTGGGGGSGGLPAGLTIYSEASSVASNNEVIITWLTNYYSTSRVIYSAENQGHTFDLNNPNYGYAFSTEEDLNMVTGHNVIITGLTPGTTYYYRVISHASPDTVGKELIFTTTGNLPTEQNQTGESQNVSQPSQGGKVISEQTGAAAGNVIQGIAKTTFATGAVAGEQAVLSEKDLLPEAPAGIKDRVSHSQPISWLIYILILCLLIFLFGYYFWRQRQKN